MADLTNYPLEDGFKTTLTQTWDWATWNINVWSTPSFTFPSWVTTYIVVNPWKSNMQIAEINAYSAVNGTMTVNNITLEKWASVNSTAQTHNVWSEVIISDNYQFWKDILDAINSKVDVEDWLLAVYADDTARDAAITSPTNWMSCYNTTDWAFNDYIGWAWTIRATWATPNATESVAGKIELPTDAEVTAKTATGWTWATICPTNAQTGKSVALKAVDATMAETDHIVFDKAWTDNKMLVSVLRDQLAASTTIKGTVELATDAEVTAWTDETRYVNSKQVKDNSIQWIDTYSTIYSSKDATFDSWNIAVTTAWFLLFYFTESFWSTTGSTYWEMYINWTLVCKTWASSNDSNSENTTTIPMKSGDTWKVIWTSTNDSGVSVKWFPLI